MMKPRTEYEKLCDKTFSLAGEAQATRIQIDLLLDIRDLLIGNLHRQTIEARQRATNSRLMSRR